MKRILWLTTLVGLILFGACGGDDTDAAPDTATDGTSEAADDGARKVQQVDVVAHDYRYDAPAELAAGTTELTMRNEGKEGHILVLARLAEGKTFDDLKAALAAPPGSAGGPPPFTEYAGIASTAPGLSSNETVVLLPGTYGFVCFLPAPDGVPHFAKGMMQPVTVAEPEAGAEEPVRLPETDGEVTAEDFSYRADLQAKAGEQVVGFENAGTQTHEITLVEFADGKGPADLAAFFEKPEGPPPATFLGGPVVAPAGSATWRTPALTAGKTYYFLCLIPDPKDQVPHVSKGMALPIRVT